MTNNNLCNAVIAEIDRLSAMKPDDLLGHDDVDFLSLLDMAVTLREEIRKQPPARNGREANECAWLIESCMQDEKGPYYLCTRKFQHSTVFDWKPDNQAALRFSRKADAESARDAIRVFMPELFPHIVPMPKAVEHCWGIRATLPTAAGADTVCVKCDAEMLRVKACEHIAEGEEGWEKVRNVCPSTMVVAELRDAYEKLLAQQAGADKAEGVKNNIALRMCLKALHIANDKWADGIIAAEHTPDLRGRSTEEDINDALFIRQAIKLTTGALQLPTPPAKGE